ncbi:hypothetical protein AAFN85_26465 [Mucilaginibacter sp. CAU 1740]|uniref:hypothetical protein n=1 Tax=Mucilaginibacter sp. CAU 1740 TaxID=3140365 RepID=UPI00325AD483
MEQYLHITLNSTSVMAESALGNMYVTDMEYDLTYSGTVSVFEEVGNTLKITLTDVKVYEYSSSNYLFSEPEISLSRPKNKLHIEKV